MKKLILDKTFFPNADILQGRFMWLIGNKVIYIFICIWLSNSLTLDTVPLCGNVMDAVDPVLTGGE
jgi:hypothetical protein